MRWLVKKMPKDTEDRKEWRKCRCTHTEKFSGRALGCCAWGSRFCAQCWSNSSSNKENNACYLIRYGLVSVCTCSLWSRVYSLSKYRCQAVSWVTLQTYCSLTFYSIYHSSGWNINLVTVAIELTSEEMIFFFCLRYSIISQHLSIFLNPMCPFYKRGACSLSPSPFPLPPTLEFPM